MPTVTLLPNSMLRLYCDGVGNPAPSFQWYKNNVPIYGATDREFLKHNVSIEDQAVYFCKVFNNVGEVVSTSTTVVLEKNLGER